MRAGDVVKHGPSGEKWVLAFGDAIRNEVSACGWPESYAKMSDCTLIEGATDTEHLKMLHDWADQPKYRDHGGGMDRRSQVCIQQLFELTGFNALTDARKVGV